MNCRQKQFDVTFGALVQNGLEHILKATVSVFESKMWVLTVITWQQRQPQRQTFRL